MSPLQSNEMNSPASTTTLFDVKMDRLFHAIAKVESNNNRFAWNKEEDARGIVQIRLIAVKEVERLYKIKLNHNDAFEVKWSYDVFILTMKAYNKNGDYEIGSRNWNGGKYGYLIPQTEVYWNKVKKELTKYLDI